MKSGTCVTLLEIETKGVVHYVREEQSVTMYMVSYWFNGERKEVWVYPDEIREEPHA